MKVTASGSDVLTVNSSGISVNGNVDLSGGITQSGQNLMLLNEVQKQHRLIEAQNDAIRRLEARLAELENRN